MSLLSCWVNRYHTIHRTYNSARTRLLSFLPYSTYYSDIRAMCGQCAAMYGNVPSAATRSILPYSARVGLYKVGGMRWERVVVCKVSRGGPVTRPYFKPAAT